MSYEESVKDEESRKMRYYEDKNKVYVEVHRRDRHVYSVYADNGKWFCTIPFQNEPVKEVGTNGLQSEHLLWVVIDRLKNLNFEVYSKETAEAISHAEKALEVLEKRTADRLKRGVESTMQK